MMQLLLVALGGAVGSVSRYLVGILSLRIAGPAFPWGTLIVNVAGSFAIGILTELILRRFSGSPELRLLIITGFLGGFTTLSSFSLDAMVLFERGAVGLSVAYVLGTVGLALLAVCAGFLIGRAFL